MRQDRRTEHIHYDGNAAREIRKQNFEQKQESLRLTQKEIRKAKIRNLKISKVFIMSICSVSVFVLMALIFKGQVDITELSHEISLNNQKLTEIRNTQLELEIQLIGTTEASEIENYVKNNLGMEKINEAQTTYINISGEDKGLVYEEAEKTWIEKLLGFFGI